MACLLNLAHLIFVLLFLVNKCVFDIVTFASCSGSGAGMDIVVSSVRAYVNALNKMLGFRSASAKRSTVVQSEKKT